MSDFTYIFIDEVSNFTPEQWDLLSNRINNKITIHSKMSVQEIVSDEQVIKAFENTNFGKNPDYRELIRQCLLKYHTIYTDGHTITCVCNELGLLGVKNKLTKKGKTYLFYAYYNKHD